MQLSIIIITKNVAKIIGSTLISLNGLSDDVVVVDSGSTDNTIEICKKYPVRIINTSWDGYGANKNKGIVAAKYPWILSLDADEVVDQQLKNSLQHFEFGEDNTVYKLHRKNFFAEKWIRFGEWAGDDPVRIFNRNKVKWNNAAVHESLLLNDKIVIKKIPGNLLHYTVRNEAEYIDKSKKYAKLNAQKYFFQNRKLHQATIFLAPTVNFLQHYIFRLGFLDGKEGYLIAKTNAKMVFLKYKYLKELKQTKK